MDAVPSSCGPLRLVALDFANSKSKKTLTADQPKSYPLTKKVPKHEPQIQTDGCCDYAPREGDCANENARVCNLSLAEEAAAVTNSDEDDIDRPGVRHNGHARLFSDAGLGSYTGNKLFQAQPAENKVRETSKNPTPSTNEGNKLASEPPARHSVSDSGHGTKTKLTPEPARRGMRDSGYGTKTKDPTAGARHGDRDSRHSTKATPRTRESHRQTPWTGNETDSSSRHQTQVKTRPTSHTGPTPDRRHGDAEHEKKANPVAELSKRKKKENLRQLESTLSRILFGMVKGEKYHPWDVQRAIEKARLKVNISNIIDVSGLNLLHMAMCEFKPAYLEWCFYLAQWLELTRQKISQVSSSPYPGLTASELCKKLLPKAKGPKIMETFEYFDQCQNSLSELSWLCLTGDKDGVQRLLSQDPGQVASNDSRGFNALAYAAASGNTEIIELLLRERVDPLTTSDKQETVLHIAAKLGRTAVVGFIIKSNRCPVNVDQVDRDKHKAIDYVALNGDVATMRAMRDNGVRPNKRCVSLAARDGRSEMVRYLVEEEKLSVQGRDDRGRTGFLISCLHGNLELLRYFLSNGSSLTETDQQGRNCLHLTAENGHTAALRFLLDRATEMGVLRKLLDVRDKFVGRETVLLVRGKDKTRSAWHYVQVQRHLMHRFRLQLTTGSIDVKLFGKILLSGFGDFPDFSRRNKLEDLFLERLDSQQVAFDMTPLHIAAFKENYDAVKELVASGADVKAVDKFGRSPLHYLAMRGNRELVELLQQHGAVSDARDEEGLTPGDVAGENGHCSLENLLKGEEYICTAEVRNF